MSLTNIKTYDLHRMFLRSITVADIANPLLSFDSETSASYARRSLIDLNEPAAGVRLNGMVAGYILCAELNEGVCADYCHEFEASSILEGSASISELIHALENSPWVFVRVFGSIAGIATREDLQDPPVRMWLFGLVTVIELYFRELVVRHFDGEGWMQHISPERIEKAKKLLDERQRRGQNPRLFDCLQFSDTAQIVVRNETLRSQVGFASRRRGDEAIKSLERLRNNLAHAQDIVSFDWETVVRLASILDRVIALVQPEKSV